MSRTDTAEPGASTSTLSRRSTAAAFSVFIFVVALIVFLITNRITRATESNIGA